MNALFLLVLPPSLDTVTAVCVNFVHKPAIGAFYCQARRAQLFLLDHYVFGARILYLKTLSPGKQIKLFVLLTY